MATDDGSDGVAIEEDQHGVDDGECQSVIAVENSSPEVIHVMSMASGSSANFAPQIYTIPSLQGTQILTSASASGLQTFTLNAGNLSFPVTLPLQHMVSIPIYNSKASTTNLAKSPFPIRVMCLSCKASSQMCR